MTLIQMTLINFSSIIISKFHLVGVKVKTDAT